MTRINAGIPVQKLCRQHLLSEHREIKRIPNVIASGKYNMNGQPERFKLGTGHVKFFYDKLLYLKNRYQAIYDECIKRGYNVTYYIDAWDNVPKSMMNDWQPTVEAIKEVTVRINERLKTMKK